MPDYADIQGFGLPSEVGLSAISKRIHGWSPDPFFETLKRHLLNAHIPKKLFKAVREIAWRDKIYGFREAKMSRRVAKIRISKTTNDLSAMDFVDYASSQSISQWISSEKAKTLTISHWGGFSFAAEIH